MLIGTDIGKNLMLVSATANVLASGMLKKRGYKINLWAYMIILTLFQMPYVIFALSIEMVFR